MKNLLIEKLNSGEKAIGTWNTLASPLVTEVLASSGLDYMFLDCEHGPFDMKNLSSHISICERYNVTPIVRVPTNENWITLQALDLGAHGVLCPQINNAQEVKKFTESCFYHPKGNRGFTPFSKGGQFGQMEGYSDKANELVSTAVIIETKEAVEDFDKIIEDDKLSMVFFGSYDLSQAYGVPGDVRNPKIIDLISTLNKKAQEKGKFTGGFLAKNNEDINWMNEMEFNFFVYGVDSQILLNSYKDGVEHFKGLGQ